MPATPSTETTTAPDPAAPDPAAPEQTRPDPAAPDDPQKGSDAPNPLLDELKQERRARRELEKRVAAMEAAAEEARRAALPEQERLIEQARREAAEEVRAEFRRKLATAQVRAAAAEAGFVDPDDASAHLDLAEIDPDDPDAVRRAVRRLAEAKPYLVAARGAPPVPGGPVSEQGRGPQSFNDWMLGAVRGRR